jgi:hypothetical protein
MEIEDLRISMFLDEHYRKNKDDLDKLAILAEERGVQLVVPGHLYAVFTKEAHPNCEVVDIYDAISRRATVRDGAIVSNQITAGLLKRFHDRISKLERELVRFREGAGYVRSVK